MQAGAAFATLLVLAGIAGLFAMLAVYVLTELTRVGKHQRGRHMGGAMRRARNWMLMWIVAGFAAGRMAKGSPFAFASAAGLAMILSLLCFALALWSVARGLRRDLVQNDVLTRSDEVVAWACGLGAGGFILWQMRDIVAWAP